MAPTERILGLQFFNGTVAEAVARLGATGGCVVMPASPALTKLRYDEDYRRALQSAEMVLPDSELLVLVWKVVTGTPIQKISGIDYLSGLLNDDGFQNAKTIWILSSTAAKARAVELLRSRGFSPAEENVFVRERAASGQDHTLLLEIEARRPNHVVIALQGGDQEQLGVYLRDYLLYRPSIHCVGAALGFLSGAEAPIPEAFARCHLGWLARLRSQPGMILPRIGTAITLARMLIRHRDELPPLKQRWSDL